MSNHGHEHGGHGEHGGGHAEHGHEKKKMGWVRRLTSIVSLPALSFFAADLAKPFTLDPVHKSSVTLLDFAPSGGGGGGHDHGGGHGHGHGH